MAKVVAQLGVRSVEKGVVFSVTTSVALQMVLHYKIEKLGAYACALPFRHYY